MKTKSIKPRLLSAVVAISALTFGLSASAATQIQWWHAMGANRWGQTRLIYCFKKVG